MKIFGGYFSRVILAAALLAMTIGGALASAADDYPAQRISAQQRCPVCGMYPARYPAWAVQVIFKNRSMISLESPMELFRFLADVKKYDAQHTAADIAKIYVTDYAQKNWIDAKQALYVQGSKVKGPMGAGLPAFADKAAAEALAKEAGGSVTTFDALAAAGHADHGGHEHGHSRR